mgnify:CR=1 FL=1
MNFIFALLVATLFGSGAYMIMRRSIVKLLFGLILLGNAANLLIFLSASPVRGRSAIVPPGQKVLTPPHADPLGQALILTAIVISFGLLAFAIILVKRTYVAMDDDDLDQLDGGRPE